jgi:hypothetical protein
MTAPEPIPDTLVTFVDDAGTEYPVAIPRLAHTNREVRTVAYRWACRQIAEGVWTPYGDLHYLKVGATL